MIEEILPGNKTKLRIITAIYENAGINITSLIKKTKASPNLVLDYVNKLLLHGVISEEKTIGRKKAHIRSLKANFNNELSRSVYSLIEINKKEAFFNKYKELKPCLLQLEELLKKSGKFALIYGSYSRFASSKESDLDLLVAGELGKDDINKIKEIFVTVDIEVSLKVDTLNKFIDNADKPLYHNMLREHIIVYGAFEFVKCLDTL